MAIYWQDLWAAIALVMVLEGMLPFVSPEIWRKMIITAVGQSNLALRLMGLMSMLIGLSVLFWVRS